MDLATGEVVTFPSRADCDILSDHDLQEWQALAYKVWYDSIKDYAALPDKELASHDWRGHLEWSAAPLATLNREVDGRLHRARTRAVVRR